MLALPVTSLHYDTHQLMIAHLEFMWFENFQSLNHNFCLTFVSLSTVKTVYDVQVFQSDVLNMAS